MRRLASFALSCCLASSLAAQTSLTPHQQLAREVYNELISINTVDSVGSVTKAAEAMAERFRAAGFPDADVKSSCPPGKPTKGNLVVRYHGRGGAATRKPILLLAHLDVVAALAQRLAARSVHARRGERLLPRPRHDRRQGDGVDLRRQPAPLQEGRLASRARHHPRAHRRRRGRRRERRPSGSSTSIAR